MRMRLLAGVILLGSLTSSIPAAGQTAPPARLFSSYEVVDLTLEAPFEELIARAQDDDDYAVTGTLSYHDRGTGATVRHDGVTVTTRGNTSRRESECEFPKLKVAFQEVPSGGSLFAGLAAVKLGTHCGDRPDGELSRRYGRLANEKAPLREAFIYQLLDLFGVPSLRARAARITYVFSGSSGQPPLARGAMLLEDDPEAIRRFAANEEIKEERFGAASDLFSPADTARLTFAQAMIGNFDWCLRMTPDDEYRCNARHPLWNVLALVRKDVGVPIMYDFDLAGMVVGRHDWFDNVLNASFGDSPAAVEVISQLQRARTLFSRADLDAVRETFGAKRGAAYSALAGSHVDEEGQTLIRSYLDAFFAAIEPDAFYRPVVVEPKTRIYVDDRGKQPVCRDGLIPVGTPVRETGEATARMIRVVVLDALWHWPDRCDVIRKNPVWIARTAVSSDYPR